MSVLSRAKSHAIKYLGASLAIAMIDMVRNIIVANEMGPYLTGLCTTLLVIPQIAQYLNLGMIDAMTVLVPRNVGQGKPEEADLLRSQIFSVTTIISILSFAGAVSLLALRPYQSFQANAMVVLSALLIFFYQGKKFFVTSYAADNEFKRLSVVETAFTVLVAATQIGLVRTFGVYGFWAGILGTNVIIMLYLVPNYFRFHSLHFAGFSLAKLKPAIHLGIPMLIYGVTYVPFLIFARLFLAKSAGMAEVGYFVLAMLLIPRLSIVPAAIAKVLLPKLSHMHAVGSDFKRSFEIYRASQLWTLALTLVIFACGLVFVGPAVKLLMPKYVNGIPAAKLILFAGIPYCLIDNANNFLLAMQRKRLYMASMVAALLVQGVIFAALTIAGMVSATSISISMVAVFAVYAMLSNAFVIRLHRRGADVVEGMEEPRTQDTESPEYA